MNRDLDLFVSAIGEAFENGQLAKFILAKKRFSDGPLEKVTGRKVEIRAAGKFQFVYRTKTQDITKNLPLDEALQEIRQLLEAQFFNGEAFTATHLLQYRSSARGNGKLISRRVTTEIPEFAHDKPKERMILPADKRWLTELGLTTPDGVVKPSMQNKYKQINRYVEIAGKIILDEFGKKPVSIADMGAGKGYLTFALYDFLTNQGMEVRMAGVEMRPELVSFCNRVARAENFSGLQFVPGSIKDHPLNGVDVLIALHACDTATDDALYKGISENAGIIMVAPCCHKQLRPQVRPENILAEITNHGILKERQSEMVTDVIRALMLEAFGYKTQVQDFIPSEHTPKNILITGVRKKYVTDPLPEYVGRIDALKKLFGVNQHYLETLLF